MKRFLIVAIALLAQGLAQGQPYPSRPISMVVPLAPGSQPDNVARVLAEKLRTSLGQPVLV